jgi:hypothetical protein
MSIRDLFRDFLIILGEIKKKKSSNIAIREI